MKRLSPIAWIAAVLLLGATAPPGLAEVRFGRAFGDGMVLQRHAALRIAGTADPGEPITVTLGPHRATDTADAQGRWTATLPPCEAQRDPLVLRAQGRSSAAEAHDVLIGEVWLCSGQSNMEYATAGAAEVKAMLAAAQNPQLRLLHFQGAATTYAGAYSPQQLARMAPERFFEGRWQHSSRSTAASFSAVALAFGERLQADLGVPVGLIQVAVGGTPTEAWVRPEAMAQNAELSDLVTGDWLKNPKLEPWCVQRAADNLRANAGPGGTSPRDVLGPNHPFKPGFCWEAGIKPLVGTTIAGVIWYQGESNALSAWRVEQHRALFTTLVEDWRRQWGRADLPWLFVQLPSMGTRRGYHSENWPAFRDQQRQLAENLGHVGMAVTIDLGDPANVHPRRKQEVGRRLARLAEVKVYGQPGPAGGPTPTTCHRDGAGVAIDFTDADGLKTADGQPVRGFELAGADGVFHPAAAELHEAQAVLRSGAVPAPARVRYAWSPYPEPAVNLVNGIGLPATPFELYVTSASK